LTDFSYIWGNKITPMKKLLLLNLVFIVSCFSYEGKISRTSFPVKPSIEIIPVGNISKSMIEFVRKNLFETFNVDVAVGKGLPLDVISFAKSSSRPGYTGIKILQRFSSGNSTKKILLLIEGRVYTRRTLEGVTYPEWSILGLAHQNACLVVPIRNQSRLQKVAIHEVGHTLGLPHCKDKKCLMTDAKGKAKNIDGAQTKFCSNCIQGMKKNYSLFENLE
jgi:archaemetzincin